jgi:hypothetical protein
LNGCSGWIAEYALPDGLHRLLGADSAGGRQAHQEQ